MQIHGQRSRGTVLLLVLLCLAWGVVDASPAKEVSPDILLSRLKISSRNDHAQFVSNLHRIEKLRKGLTQQQRQKLKYWLGWEAQHQGSYALARRIFQQVVDHADDPSLVIRAKSQLILNYMINRQYVKAFTLANALIANLHRIRDHDLRSEVLNQAIEILIWQKQYDQALKFARQLKATARTDKATCQADYAVVNTQLQRGGVLTASSPKFRQTIDECLAAGNLTTANTLRLDWASLMDDEGRTQQAIGLLHRITPDIMKNGFQSHIVSLYVTLAQANLIEKKYGPAAKWARATLAGTDPGSFTWTRQAAYKVLYQAQEKEGDYQSSLATYKQYHAQYKASTDDAGKQALAYQIVKQEVLSKRLKLEELSKQNRILQLRQSLDHKSAETNRLYIALLLVVLASIAFWTWRIKHSQIRFRKMARHDDLTGIFNRQYFFDQAGHALQRLHKAGDPACLMILDMDHFKRINDAYGHVAGDTVLKHVVRTCREQLRDSDVFGRLGGEEFGVLMPGCSVAQATEIGERVRRSLARSPVQVLESESVTVTSSIGLACTETHGYALKPLLMAADHALYGAKRGGRNRLVTRTDQTASIRT